MFELEFTDRSFKEIIDIMEAISWSSSEERGRRFYIEFDGEFLKIYRKDKKGSYTYLFEKIFDLSYYEEADEDDLSLPEPFRARIRVGCIRGILKTIEEEYGEYDNLERILMIRIFTDKDKLYFQLLDRTKCGAYGNNIVHQCTFKIEQ
jgi:hypothetical protein